MTLDKTSNTTEWPFLYYSCYNNLSLFFFFKHITLPNTLNYLHDFCWLINILWVNGNCWIQVLISLVFSNYCLENNYQTKKFVKKCPKVSNLILIDQRCHFQSDTQVQINQSNRNVWSQSVEGYFSKIPTLFLFLIEKSDIKDSY